MTTCFFLSLLGNTTVVYLQASNPIEGAWPTLAVVIAQQLRNSCLFVNIQSGCCQNWGVSVTSFMLHWLRISLAEAAGIPVLGWICRNLSSFNGSGVVVWILLKLDLFICSWGYFCSATAITPLNVFFQKHICYVQQVTIILPPSPQKYQLVAALAPILV